MSSSVSHGLQSCLAVRLSEPRVANDKLAPPRSNISQSIPWSQKANVSQQQQEQRDNSCNENEKNIITNRCSSVGGDEYQCNKGRDLGWSFLQALASNASQTGKQVTAEAEQVYVHPLVKPSSSALSTRSLEMCTESLGSETGSSIDDIIEDFSYLSPEKQSYQGIKRSRSREFPKKLDRSLSFPPPLTSISGSDGVQVRPHREGGRLVLKAVSSRSRTCFHAERVDGRLLLFSLSEDGYSNSEDEVELEHGEEFAHENRDEEQDYSEETDDGGDEEEDDDESSFPEDDMEDESANFECEIGVQEFPRLSRCKEGGARNRGMPSWEPCCVVIS